MEVVNLFEIVQPRLADFLLKKHGNLALITQFVDAAPRTVQDWAHARQPAKGVRLIRLWHFLAAAGYESPEINEMPEFNRYLSELFAYGVVTHEEATELCGVHKPQAALRAMRGQPPMHPAFTVEDMKGLYDQRLNEAKESFSRQLKKGSAPPAKRAIAAVPSAAPPREPTPPVSSGTEGVVPLGSKNPVMTAATLLSAALPLVRYINSDRCSAADRDFLRTLMGDDGIFELSNHFNSLCGERARSTRR
jgi:hypothetical protein